jgi:hypothetical protein
MAQYWDYPNGTVQYRTDTSGLRVRFGQLGGLYVTDVELMVGGFSLAENVGWERLSSSTSALHVGNYREGVRGGVRVLDSQLADGSYEQLI